MSRATNNPMLTESEVASFLNVSVHWLRRRRAAGGGPMFCKFGSTIRYRVSELDKYVAENSFMKFGVLSNCQQLPR